MRKEEEGGGRKQKDSGSGGVGGGSGNGDNNTDALHNVLANLFFTFSLRTLFDGSFVVFSINVK